MKALNISIFSLLSSFILFNFAALIIILNRNKTAFMSMLQRKKFCGINP